MSSDSFPWMSEYLFEELPNFKVISKLLEQIGDKVKSNKMRISYHPSPFNIIASTRQDVIYKAINELDQHATLMDLMGLEQSTYYPINIHVGTTQPTREEAAQKFCQSFKLLSESCQKRFFSG